jgi:hypothetical protein
MADDETPDPMQKPKVGAKNVEPDEELIKLRRSRPKIGALTAAGVLFLAIFFLLKLNPDRRFAGQGDTPAKVGMADLAAGKVERDAFVAVPGEPLMAHAIRVGPEKKSLGLRVVPLRGSGERVWIVLPGDGWENPSMDAYVGRVRALPDLPFVGAMEAFLAEHPRPSFATASAVRAGFQSNQVATVAGDTVTVRDNDKIGFDVVEPNAAVVVGTYNDRLPNLAAWQKALTDAGIAVTGGRDDRERVYFDVSAPGAVASITTKLEASGLWAARVDPVTHHHETTWRALKQSGPAGFTIAGLTIPDAQLDLIGLYVLRAIPSGAYAVITGEKPQDYWYVLPVEILVGVIALLFAWALVRAVRRDFDFLWQRKDAPT